jgi:hypothetical protein
MTLSAQIVAVGDIMLGRGIRHTNSLSAFDLLDTEVANHLKGDIVTGNLECLVGESGSPNPVCHSHFQGGQVFSEKLVRLFDVVSLANNHINDFGEAAIAETIDWLARIGVRWTGIGKNLSEATEPVCFENAGGKFAVFSATTVNPLASWSSYKVATPGRALSKRAQLYKKAGYHCILNFHGGGGDVCHPAPYIRSMLLQMASSDFKVVFGHHPHVVQGYLIRANNAIFFSLGDFVFDKFEGGRDKSLLVKLSIDPRGNISSNDVIAMQRTSGFEVSCIKGEQLDEYLKMLREQSRLIETGESDLAYAISRGSKARFLLRSLRRDYQVGGLRALIAKLSRINRRKLIELLLSK